MTGLLFGVAPAAQTTNPSLTGAMKEGGHGTTAHRPGRGVRSVLVVAEIALAFVLLVASGLLMRSFFNLLDVDPGFTATNVLTAGLPIRQDQHPDPLELNAYLASIRAAVAAVPGVRETAITSALPLQGWGYGVPYSIAGRDWKDEANRPLAFFKTVSPSYFDALGIKLLAGRVLSDSDRAGAPPAALINETLAKREFPDEDPIGRRILVRDIVAGQDASSARRSPGKSSASLRARIKQVVDDLGRELPGLKTFATMSPVPGFLQWLSESHAELRYSRKLRTLLAGLASGTLPDPEAIPASRGAPESH